MGNVEDSGRYEAGSRETSHTYRHDLAGSQAVLGGGLGQGQAQVAQVGRTCTPARVW